MATAFVFSNKRDFSDDRDKTYVKRELFKVFPLFFILFFFLSEDLWFLFMFSISLFFLQEIKTKTEQKGH